MPLPVLSKVNKRYSVNGMTVLYFQIVVPDDRAGEIRGKLNVIVDWFMSRNRLKAMNKRAYDMGPIPFPTGVNVTMHEDDEQALKT